MYLLDTQQVMDLFSLNHGRPVFGWLGEVRPRATDLFASVISLGQIAHAVEGMTGPERTHWRRLHQEGRRKLEAAGSVIDVDGAIVDVWHSELRGDNLADVEGAEEGLGEDDRLIIATAIARRYSLVTVQDRVLVEVAERTGLTLVAP